MSSTSTNSPPVESPPSKWTCIYPTDMTYPYTPTEFDDLSNRYPYMDKSIVERYKQEAIDRLHQQDDDIDDEGNDEIEYAFDAEKVTQNKILAKAEKIVLTRFVKVAKMKPPPARKRVKCRSPDADIDNFERHADDEPPSPALKPLLKKAWKRKALDDVPAADNALNTPASTSPRPTKRVRFNDDKENNPPLPTPPSDQALLDDTAPYNIGVAVNIADFTPSKAPVIKPTRCPSPNLESPTPIEPTTPESMDWRDPISPITPFGIDECLNNHVEMDEQIKHAPPQQLYKNRSTEPALKTVPEELSSDEAFSDDTSLFEELLATQDSTTTESSKAQHPIPLPQNHIPTPPPSTSTKTTTTLQAPTVKQATPSNTTSKNPPSTPTPAHHPSHTTTTPTSPPDQSPTPTSTLLPFIRPPPPSPLTPSSHHLVSLLPTPRLITAFRIAEVLRLRSTLLSSPIPVDTPYPYAPRVLNIELYASLRSMNRRGLGFVVEFEDLFFPGRPPCLVGLHGSWRIVEAEVEGVPGGGGGVGMGKGLVRAILRLRVDVRRPASRDGEGEIEVLNMRMTDVDELRVVRGIVEARFQELDEGGGGEKGI